MAHLFDMFGSGVGSIFLTLVPILAYFEVEMLNGGGGGGGGDLFASRPILMLLSHRNRSYGQYG